MHNGFTHESTCNETIEWYTPPIIFQRLNLTFDLDPASPGKNIIPYLPAKYLFTVEDDGLAQQWFGRVWLNPPYGSQTGKWLRKFMDHHNGIALVFSRTDTKWFQNYARECDIVCFIKGRLAFWKNGRKGGTAAAGSILLGCGRICVDTIVRSKLGNCARFLC